VSWLEGFPDKAEALAAEAVDLAMADGPIVLCQVVGLAAIPIAFWRGDKPRARALTEIMLEQSRRFALDRWTDLAIGYSRCANIGLGIAEPHSPDKFGVPAPNPMGALYRDLLSTISADWIDAATITRAEGRKCGWANAEILRAVAMRSAAGGSRGNEEGSELLLQQALAIARKQGEVAWELRATMSLVQLRRANGDTKEPLNALVALCTRFSEGSETTDLRKARALIVECGSAH
jgi:hypothetical protein